LSQSRQRGRPLCSRKKFATAGLAPGYLRATFQGTVPVKEVHLGTLKNVPVPAFPSIAPRQHSLPSQLVGGASRSAKPRAAHSSGQQAGLSGQQSNQPVCFPFFQCSARPEVSRTCTSIRVTSCIGGNCPGRAKTPLATDL
jgi:hypothetical protein